MVPFIPLVASQNVAQVEPQRERVQDPGDSATSAAVRMSAEMEASAASVAVERNVAAVGPAMH